MGTSSAVVPSEDPAIGRAVTVLLEMYKENTNHGRHLETQRQLVTGFILTIAAAALGALSTLKFKSDACVGLGAVLVIFGLMGTAFSVVQYGKWVQSRARWRAARTQIAALCPMARLDEIVATSYPANGTKDNPTAWLNAGNTPLHWLWTLLMLIVSILGLCLVVNAAKLSCWAGS